MTFHVVETLDPGGIKDVFLVSSQWIKKNVLFWPPTKLTRTKSQKVLLKCLPDESWIQIPKFKILQPNIELLEMANSRVNFYSRYTNTDSEIEERNRLKLKRQHPITYTETHLDFNAEFKRLQELNKPALTSTCTIVSRVLSPQSQHISNLLYSSEEVSSNHLSALPKNNRNTTVSNSPDYEINLESDKGFLETQQYKPNGAATQNLAPKLSKQKDLAQKLKQTDLPKKNQLVDKRSGSQSKSFKKDEKANSAPIVGSSDESNTSFVEDFETDAETHRESPETDTLKRKKGNGIEKLFEVDSQHEKFCETEAEKLPSMCQDVGRDPVSSRSPTSPIRGSRALARHTSTHSTLAHILPMENNKSGYEYGSYTNSIRELLPSREKPKSKPILETLKRKHVNRLEKRTEMQSIVKSSKTQNNTEKLALIHKGCQRKLSSIHSPLSISTSSTLAHRRSSHSPPPDSMARTINELRYESDGRSDTHSITELLSDEEIAKRRAVLETPIRKKVNEKLPVTSNDVQRKCLSRSPSPSSRRSKATHVPHTWSYSPLPAQNMRPSTDVNNSQSDSSTSVEEFDANKYESRKSKSRSELSISRTKSSKALEKNSRKGIKNLTKLVKVLLAQQNDFGNRQAAMEHGLKTLTELLSSYVVRQNQKSPRLSLAPLDPSFIMPRFQFSTVREVNTLNKSCLDDSYVDQMVIRMKRFVSTKEKNHNKSVKDVMEHMFKYELISLYSWTGKQDLNSDSISKFPFHSLHGVISLIIKVCTFHLIYTKSIGADVLKSIKIFIRRAKQNLRRQNQ